MNKYTVAGAMLALLFPAAAFAFAVTWVPGGSTVIIESPTAATAYFGTLKGEPQKFTISSGEAFTLYLNILVPQGGKHDISVAVVDPKAPTTPLGVLLGETSAWGPYSFGGDAYEKGPEYRATLPAGTYDILLWSSNNDSPYVLVMGEDEPSIFTKIFSAFGALPTIKSEMFGRSSASAVFEPVIFWPLAILIVLVLAGAWFIYRQRARRTWLSH